MKQILQGLRGGEIVLEDVAAPSVRPGSLLIRSTRSLISSGTERSVVEFARAGYLAKARQQPDRVKEVLGKVRTDGLMPTVEAVRGRLDQPALMGYCNVGRVIAVGDGVEGFEVGDLVASNGNHAEIVLVPQHLCAKVPLGVPDDDAAFTVIGSIALQGVRLVQPTLGESVAVFGLGLVGLMAVQVLRAHGARVVGFDTDPHRVALARSWGFEAHDPTAADPVQAAVSFSGGPGVDGVLITASTPSHDLVHQAAEMSRKRGRIVLTGVVGLNLRRSDFYDKELTFQVSCSYGPGRYDPSYEEQGRDYPIGYVRWTEQRNFQAVLELLADGRLRVDELISERVPFEEAPRAYDLIASKSVIGVLLTYPEPSDRDETPARTVEHAAPRRAAGKMVCGVIGAGAFAQAKLLPALDKAGVRLKWAASSGGVSGSVSARRFGIERSTTDVGEVLSDPEVNSVVIATRHATHADLTVRALEAGKSVFVEKPLCLTEEELDRIVDAYEKAATAGAPVLMVGFNRRFAPMVRTIAGRLSGRREPVSMVFTCNAGPIPADHWVHDPNSGGGRILGEACHFVDLLHYLAASPIRAVSASGMDSPTGDTAAITLAFADGSLGQVNYFANGSKRYPKEFLEVYSQGRVLRLENFRKLQAYGFGPKASKRTLTQDKGHADEVAAFVKAVEHGGEPPIPFDSLVNVSRATIAAVRSMRERTVVTLP